MYASGHFLYMESTYRKWTAQVRITYLAVFRGRVYFVLLCLNTTKSSFFFHLWALSTFIFMELFEILGGALIIIINRSQKWKFFIFLLNNIHFGYNFVSKFWFLSHFILFNLRIFARSHRWYRSALQNIFILVTGTSGHLQLVFRVNVLKNSEVTKEVTKHVEKYLFFNILTLIEKYHNSPKLIIVQYKITNTM